MGLRNLEWMVKLRVIDIGFGYLIEEVFKSTI